MNVSTEGLEQLIVTIFELLSKVDLKQLDTEFFAQILDRIYPLWNPIWKLISLWLTAQIGF